MNRSMLITLMTSRSIGRVSIPMISMSILYYWGDLALRPPRFGSSRHGCSAYKTKYEDDGNRTSEWEVSTLMVLRRTDGGYDPSVYRSHRPGVR